MTSDDYKDLAGEFDSLDFSQIRIADAEGNPSIASNDPDNDVLFKWLFQLGLNNTTHAALATQLIAQQEKTHNMERNLRNIMFQDILDRIT